MALWKNKSKIGRDTFVIGWNTSMGLNTRVGCDTGTGE